MIIHELIRGFLQRAAMPKTGNSSTLCDQRKGVGKRARELVTVTLAAFFLPVTSSILVLFGQVVSYDPAYVRFRTTAMMVFELLTLALLVCVLARRQGGVRELGITSSFFDVLHSVVLAAGAYATAGVCYALVYVACVIVTGSGPAAPRQPGIVVLGMSGLAVAFMWVNAFYEELIVRAYLMTEVAAISGRIWMAVLVSTCLQFTYHLYQGLPSALSLAAAFLLFSLYYAKARRITPVILAHLYLDLFALAYYAK